MEKIIIAFLSFYFLVISVNLNGQPYEVSKLESNKCDFIFPYFRNVNNVKAQNKINTFLQVINLEIVPGAFKICPFERVMGNSLLCCSSMNFETFEIYTNTKNILSLAIEGEGTGAYTESFYYCYTFNALTGDVVYLNDFFTHSGFNIIKNKIILNRKERINNFIKQTEIEKKTLTNEWFERANDQIRLYSDCLKSIEESDLQYDNFYIKDNDLILVRNRCSPHVIRALDDLGSFVDTLKIGEITGFLSEYGKGLLGKGPIKKNTSLLKNGNILTGFINSKYPITCIVSIPSNTNNISIAYWYNRKKEVIEWHGKLVGNKLELIENDYHDEKLKVWVPRAKIKAIANQNSLTGYWIEEKSGKAMKLYLKRYE